MLFWGLAEREVGGYKALRPDPVFPTGKSLAFSLDSKIPKSLAVVAYPTEDFWDIKRTPRLNILADIFTERLREGIREKMRAAYSPLEWCRTIEKDHADSSGCHHTFDLIWIRRSKTEGNSTRGVYNQWQNRRP